LRDAIGRVLGDSVALVDSAEALAQTVNGSMGAEPVSGVRAASCISLRETRWPSPTPAEVIGEVEGEVVPLPVTELIALQYSA
jgi:hypothetical protein